MGTRFERMLEWDSLMGFDLWLVFGGEVGSEWCWFWFGVVGEALGIGYSLRWLSLGTHCNLYN
jgi:hypothetical protein